MMVVRVRSDGAADVIGSCDDVRGARPGVLVRVQEQAVCRDVPLPIELEIAARPVAVFQCIEIGLGCWKETAVVYRCSGPSPRLLPGWQPSAGRVLPASGDAGR